ncbi:MAG: hypothetical protein P1P69_01035 [Methanosarcinaceae archaeon]|nr:hypothetical protein [Methanosarcinaceae archaeon]MDF1533073.1 hypothetical protein [Methanosarcinaceae archaeon]
MDFILIKEAYIDPIYPIIAFIGFAASGWAAYNGYKLYNVTKGASDFWMFLSAFMGSITVYSGLLFARTTFLIGLEVPIKALQDLTIIAAAVYAALAAIYIKRMFDALSK